MTGIADPSIARPKDLQSQISVKEPSSSQARDIAEMYQAALGEGGIYAPGCDQYPDPDLFSAEGVKAIIEAPERQLIVAALESAIIGGAIIDWLDAYHCEINCVAVPKNKRGIGISSVLFAEAKKIIDQSLFVVNATEFVTHSLGSQAGHLRDGRVKFVGFSYCHYPRVFYRDHPESVVWLTLFQGQVAEALRAGRVDNRSAQAINIVRSLSEKRVVYLPAKYAPLAKEILSQFSEYLQYEIAAGDIATDSQALAGELTIDRKGSYRYANLTFPAGFGIDSRKGEVEEALKSLISSGKQFILARIPINDPAAIALPNT